MIYGCFLSPVSLNMASCSAITAIICVLITTVATIVAFSTPNWMEFDGNSLDMLCQCSNCDCGLWLHCSGGTLSATGSLDNCRWFFADDFMVERDLPGVALFNIIVSLSSLTMLLKFSKQQVLYVHKFWLVLFLEVT